MKILEQTSTHLILKDSVKSAWGIRLFCTPFLILGCIGIFLVISEQTFPSFFIVFCILIGVPGVFLSTVKTVVLDQTQNKFSIIVQRLLGRTKQDYSLNEISVRIKETPFRVTTHSSILTPKKEPIYVVVLEMTSSSKKIYLSGNYSFTQNEAVKIANLIRTFLNKSR
ncbi:hypothetical protein [Lyngbya sp. PCC 8106]|uniref:hypothetical protein n=1 Tax=Lyngbya sp. (strain PCC 8106) TaxID=313612 RepID=UPI0000EA95DD|nr:hypothetical protein [Lyngbya sp. PCC 8106]EAW35054.1 hypothetical protein L8106_08061 [Lyngbya sp. PCC 8106]